MTNLKSNQKNRPNNQKVRRRPLVFTQLLINLKMKKNNYTKLIFKKLKGDISLEEQSILDVWEGTSSENAQLSNQLEKDWELTADYTPQIDFEVDVDGDFRLLQQRIDADANLVTTAVDKLHIANQPIGKVVAMSSKKTSTRWIGWASAAVIALALGFWFMGNQQGITSDTLVAETRYQEKKTLTLNDGTTVWLNDNSQLTYPTAFSDDTRVVQLTGEAFFDVTKNPAKPFIIETNKSKVTVLGTSFNVRSRLAENLTEVLVKTGKVRLENSAGDKKVELTPNQKGIHDVSNDSVTEMEEKNMNDLAWHNDKLIFLNTPLNEVLDDLQRLFDVEISLADTELNDCSYGAIHEMKEGIDAILDAIADAYKMNVKKVGNNSFELRNGSCQ